MLNLAIIATALHAIGLNSGAGVARFNGVPVAIDVAADERRPDAIFAALAVTLAGKHTVTSAGTFVMISNLRSASCPTCRVPTLENLAQIESETYTVAATILPNGQTLIVGCESGKISEAMKRAGPGPLSYEGSVLGSIVDSWSITVQTSYAFQGTTVRSLSAASPDRPEAARAGLRGVLEAQGFSRLGSGEEPGIEPWVKDDIMIAFAVEAGHTTRIFVHESSVRP